MRLYWGKQAPHLDRHTNTHVRGAFQSLSLSPSAPPLKLPILLSVSAVSLCGCASHTAYECVCVRALG